MQCRVEGCERKLRSDNTTGVCQTHKHLSDQQKKAHKNQAVNTAKWREANPERAAAANLKWREANRERCRELSAAARKRNAERAAADPEFRTAQLAKVAAYSRRHYQANRDAYAERNRTYYESDPARSRAMSQAWVKEHPDRARENARNAAARRQARKLNQWVEDVDVAVVWQRDGGVCHICKKAADPNDWHLEHIVPLARGGEHSYANTAVSHPVCNLRKGVKLLG